MNEFRNQLVGPRDLQFRHTKYRAPETILRCIKLELGLPLKQSEMEKHGVITSPLLSFFGIYLHKQSGVLIVLGACKSSFTVRLDQYEIQDVIVRSERLEVWKQNQAKEGEHYIKGTLSIDVDTFTAFDLIDEVLKLDPTVPYEVTSSNVKGIKIPLLPVYIGYSQNGALHSINFEDKGYKKLLRRCGCDRLTLFQRLYHSLEIINFPVSLTFWGIDTSFKDVMASILNKQINGITFLDDILRVVMQNESTSTMQVLPSQSTQMTSTALEIEKENEREEAVELTTKEIDEGLELLMQQVDENDDLVKSADLHPVLTCSQSEETQCENITGEFETAMSDEEKLSSNLENEGSADKINETVEETLAEESGSTGIDELKQNKNVGKGNTKPVITGVLNRTPMKTKRIIPKKRLMKQITDILAKKKLLYAEASVPEEKAEASRKSVETVVAGSGMGRRLRSQTSIVRSIGLVSEEDFRYQCNGCGRTFEKINSIEVHTSLCKGGNSKGFTRHSKRSQNKETKLAEAFKERETENNNSTNDITKTKERASESAIVPAPVQQYESIPQVERSQTNKKPKSAYEVIQEMAQREQQQNEGVIAEGPEEAENNTQRQPHGSVEEDPGSEPSQSTLGADLDTGTQLQIEERNGKIVKLGVEYLLDNS